VTTIEGATKIASVDANSSAAPTTEHEVLVERLQRRFAAVPSAHVRMIVDEVAQRLENARITQYLPVLIERMARDELTRQETSR
jgi:hypothetical protein